MKYPYKSVRLIIVLHAQWQNAYIGKKRFGTMTFCNDLRIFEDSMGPKLRLPWQQKPNIKSPCEVLVVNIGYSICLRPASRL